MYLDTENKIIKLCAQGMSLEGEGKQEAAAALFLQAWSEATIDLEKFTAAHYVARHQKTIADKLKWDQTALHFALKDDSLKASYPSLYLNIAKCYEDLKDFSTAKTNYDLANSYTHLLPDDGYGKLIKQGINNGIERITKQNNLQPSSQ